MTIQLAPQQGWGIYWNAAHPDQPFTPIVTGPASATAPGATVSSLAASGQGDATTGMPATLGHVTAGGSSPPVMLTTSDTGSSSPPTLSLTHADATAAPVQPVASAATDIHAPAGTQGEGSGLSDSGSGDTLVSLALNGPDYADHGWFIVPSTTNEYGDPGGSGQGFAAADDFSFDVAGGSFSSDWFYV